MSDYLAGKGSSVTSREILVEAKRLNYAPKCAPDRGTVACLLMDWADTDPFAVDRVSVSVADDEQITAIGRAIAATEVLEIEHQDGNSRLLKLLGLVPDKIKQFLLWPSGFGAAPEIAIYCILIGVIVCYLFYAGNGVRQETGKEYVVKVHCNEGVAIRIGPEPCAGVCEASVGDDIVQPLSREIGIFSGADAFPLAEGNTAWRVIASALSARRGRRPWHVSTLLVQELGDLMIGQEGVSPLGPHREGEKP